MNTYGLVHNNLEAIDKLNVQQGLNIRDDITVYLIVLQSDVAYGIVTYTPTFVFNMDQ